MKNTYVKTMLSSCLILGTPVVSAYSNIGDTIKEIHQSRVFKGVVLDESGVPIIGANIVQKGTSNGTITDFDGNFELNFDGNDEFQISYIGYISRTVKLGDKSSLKIVLREDSKSLEEIVVVGYGTQKKVNLTGSVESISNDEIENRPIKSVTDALQGTALGVTVSSMGGEPGQFSSISVRGSSSLNSGGVLVLIDGMPGDLNLINPQDIENISILKDAASSAIYGSRASEGVILVTTKNGNSERTKIEYSGNISFNKPTRYPKSTNALEHARLANIAFVNAGLSPVFSDEAIAAIQDPEIINLPNGNDWIYTADNNWIDLMIDNSFQQNHNLSISRSQKNLKYLFSANWLDQNGMFSEYGPDNFDRFNFRSNVSLDLLDNILTFDSRISFSRSEKKYVPGQWTIPNLVFKQSGPNMPIYDSNGNYARFRMQGNPIQVLKEGGNGSNVDNILDGVFTLHYKPIPQFSFKAVGGVRLENNYIKDWKRSYGKYGPNGLISMGNGQSDPNSITMSSSNTRYISSQLLAEYKETFDKHFLSVLAGWSTESEYYRFLSASRINITGNELPSLNLGSTTGWSNLSDETKWALLSGFMRFNYSYDDKYLFEANFRADGSSKFSAKNKWGVFPSFSLGWRITQEEFMRNQNLFSNLKLRASWGQLGNQNGLGLYDHIPQYVVDGYYPFGGELAQWATMQLLPSLDRTWETVDMKNLALDASFMNNRLSFTAEYFIKTNKNMLVDIEVPSVIGIKVPTGNYGKLQVKGWEASASWRDSYNGLNYSIKLNLFDQVDKLLDYGVNFSGFTSGINQKIQGYSIGSIFGFETDGYFQTTEEAKNAPAFNKAIQDAGDIKYIDQDGDGKISAPNDLVYLGTTMPRYEFGAHFSADFKGVDFSCLFQGVAKKQFYLNGEVFQPFRDTWNNYSYTYYSDYWTPDNPDALLPRLYASVKHNYQLSSHWIQNAAYVRLKNLQLGYTLPSTLTKNVNIDKVRIYFSGENLFEITSMFKYFDPEINDQSGSMYPIMRSFSFGVNIIL